MASRRLGIQQLAQRVIHNGDQDAAIVLGDYQSEAGLKSIETGRVRPARFEIIRHGPSGAGGYADAPKIMTPAELGEFERIRTIRGRSRFSVPAREHLYNLNYYSARPSGERWRTVFSMWITPPRATYQALIRAGILPRSIRFSELRWHDITGSTHGGDEEVLAEQIYLRRVPRNRIKSMEVFLLTVRRMEPSGGPTDEIYPGRPGGRRS